jgi:hypothetical protein
MGICIKADAHFYLGSFSVGEFIINFEILDVIPIYKGKIVFWWGEFS